ncbi:LysR family transcriptional regulator [Thermoflavimicrobium dichotomicum]|uniref:DNA-binding transcriptional regulator, LysR family n=1 Tax=Thermoflavimicrobium dichotomicum TaxID=46223 RepID=A0A1I3QFD9_9BACL|nr:LysR family transcriptional regulator [Thermoflavimicrobium dichotomicum]SFJ32874.1 DNA-binding transcriptional regulator, LysR family [Thermoflavimicrobium dichotomicum]
MELRQLHTFKVVAELGGFTRAAEKLGYAQSSVTAQIQALEEELGAPLFDRLGKKIVLTEAGKRLLPYAIALLQTHDEAKKAVQGGQEPSGMLVIGAPESLASFRLPEVIQKYKRLFPQVKIILKPGVCWEMRNMLRRGELDVAFLLEPEMKDEDLKIEPLVVEKMALIVSADHPLASLDHVEAEDLRGETFLHTEAGCSYRAIFEQYLRKHAIETDPDLEFWSIEAIKSCIYAGLGIGYLPLITCRKEVEEGRLAILNWEDPNPSVVTQLAYHKKKWLTPALREWIHLVREYAKEWRENQG